MIVVKRSWLPLAVIVLVAIAGFAVYRLHGVFGVHRAASAVSGRADDIKPFDPKRVTLEVFGSAGSVADINAGLFRFTPAANAWGIPYTTFTFQVQDDGGTANGGIDLDPTPRTMTINVYGM